MRLSRNQPRWAETGLIIIAAMCLLLFIHLSGQRFPVGDTLVVPPKGEAVREESVSAPSGCTLSSLAAFQARSEPFYGVQYVPIDELAAAREMGVEVVLMDFAHDGPREDWIAYLDEACSQKVQVVAWLWPPGWTWNGTAWELDDQAVEFVRAIAEHPALLAVYSLHEPYWNDCEGCGYTTAQQQDLYATIKEIADVPIWSAVDSMAFWTAQGEETAFADGVCDYCETWYFPFKWGGVYERDELVERVTADEATVRERAPNSKIVWTMQSFAQGAPYYLRMPTNDEMYDLASIVYAADVDGALWYPWVWGDQYSDFLSNHPELYPTVREIYDDIVLQARGNARQDEH
jgi:hypothetical protein